ncbi:MAG: hypothetical protein HYT09_01430 [Candidatus Levybacteria bacterium]|nr:hypothetical protein [Candidatus Levybacteria bacterium]
MKSMAENNNRGKGWFGDPQGHARAGKKGGEARSRNQSNRRRGEQQTNM